MGAAGNFIVGGFPALLGIWQELPAHDQPALGFRALLRPEQRALFYAFATAQARMDGPRRRRILQAQVRGFSFGKWSGCAQPSPLLRSDSDAYGRHAGESGPDVHGKFAGGTLPDPGS